MTIPATIDPKPTGRLRAPENVSATDDEKLTPEGEAVLELLRKSVATGDLPGVADDLLIAIQIRQRDAADSGDRITLEDFVREMGYEPTDFGL